MCDKHAAPAANACLPGSRRRRVWELSQASHCPLVGVALPLGVLRKLVERVTGGRLLHDDYDIHVGAVSECAVRKRLSEAIQKELEARYAIEVARSRKAKSTEQVAELWAQAVAAGNVPGAFWAALSHARCTPGLEQQMCRDIHMVQHQAGACVRADIERYHAVVAGNARLAQELARLQARCQALLQEKTEQAGRYEGQLMAAREEALRAQVAALKAAAAQAPLPAVPVASPAVAPAAPAEAPVRLFKRSVLCVGGRSGSVPVYRKVIERVGAQFAHHDGGLEDSAGQLDATLAAADLVICQTGCISHHAYWRVKDHCKRTGKRCIFIDNPSVSSLVRGLQEASEEA